MVKKMKSDHLTSNFFYRDKYDGHFHLKTPLFRTKKHLHKKFFYIDESKNIYTKIFMW